MSGLIERRGLWLALGLFLAASATHGEVPATIEVTIKDQRFSPAEIHVRTGKPTFLAVTNLDSAPEEFEMLQLAIEKVIPGGAKARIRVRPLGPGRYAFRGEFHQDTAQGVLVSE